jgi:hypothetical protein
MKNVIEGQGVGGLTAAKAALMPYYPPSVAQTSLATSRGNPHVLIALGIFATGFGCMMSKSKINYDWASDIAVHILNSNAWFIIPALVPWRSLYMGLRPEHLKTVKSLILFK